MPGCDGVMGVRLVFAAGSTPISDEKVDVFGVDASGAVVPLTENQVSFDPSFAPDGELIVFARRGLSAGSDAPSADGLWVMDASGGQERLLADVVGAAGPRYAPDGKSIAFLAAPEGEPPRVHTKAADGSGIEQLTEDVLEPTGFRFAGESEVAWSPDGTSLASPDGSSRRTSPTARS